MANPVVHFEVIGREPDALKTFYGDLFGWRPHTEPAAPEVSDDGAYGFVDAEGTIPGGIAGGAGFTPHVVFYVGVEDVELALAEAVTLGGTRVLGPAANPNGQVVVGQFLDPEGNLIGVARPR